MKVRMSSSFDSAGDVDVGFFWEGACVCVYLALMVVDLNSSSLRLSWGYLVECTI